MIRSKENQPIEYKCIRGGIGEVEMQKLLLGADEMYGKGRMFNLMTIAPGNSIGEHTHEGDNEIFYVLEGEAQYNDNGTVKTVVPGDVLVCNSGEKHALVNTGSVPFKMIAVILYN